MAAAGRALVQHTLTLHAHTQHHTPSLFTHASLAPPVGMMVRDPRMVERKKPGQRKARAKFQWVRR